MNYERLLARMPAELRVRLEAETVYAPWLLRGQSLESLWQDEVVLETVYNRLATVERTLLETIVRRIGSEPFDNARLERAAGGKLSGAEVQAGIAGLRRKGFVFAFRKSWGELVYVLPEDALPRWQRILHPFLADPSAEGLEPDSLQPDGGTGQEPVIVLFDVLTLIAKQETKLTRNGTLPKKMIQRINELLPWEDKLLQGLMLKYAYADAYPLKTALALDMLLKLGWVYTADEELRLQEEPVREFFHLTRSRQNGRLYRLWKELAWPASAWQQHAVLLMEKFPLGEWFAPEGLLERLYCCGFIEGPDDARDATERLQMFREQWLEPLLGFGWLEQGFNGRDCEGSASVYYRWRLPLGRTEEETVGEASGAFIVQPDFHILVPPDVPLSVQWELICVCELPVRDMLSVCKLTKASLKHALEQGRTADDALRFLEEHAEYGLPDNVRLTVRQWAKSFGQTSLSQVVLLRCDDAGTADAISRLSPVSKLLGERIGDKHYIVGENDLKPLAAALEKAGFMAGLPAADTTGDSRFRYFSLLRDPEQGETQPQREREPELEAAAAKGLVYSRHSIGYLQMEPRLPEPADLYPELRDIPAAWLRDYRNYHPSTRKDMVEKAIELRTLLQIRKGGADVRLAPRKVQETRGTWCMTGLGRTEGGGESGEEIRLLADEWQEMKLILPGINDKY